MHRARRTRRSRTRFSRIDTGADTDADADADTGTGTDPLSTHEREEAAKDELGTARAALERGDLEAAAAALERAGQFDPNNPDIVELRGQMFEARPDGG